ncbi:MAG: phosphate ABC transporter permease subunit PstC [Actinomycetota bacterium]|nr:phosphate ABC transporter permease subunit PstC [Actinomycetota bacterium]
MEKAIRSLLVLCGLISVLTTVGIVMALLSETINFFREISPLDYFTGTSWAPTFGRNASFGVLPLINGTLMVTAIAVLFAVPLGLAIAIYLSEYAPAAVRRWLKPFLEILAGIPTVVLGFFALNFVTPVVLRRIFPTIDRFNALSAGLVVGLMIIPTIASLSEDALRAVPSSLREGAYALGATRRITALRVIVPAALSGLAASVILAMSRAIGETMIVAIAANAAPRISFNPLEGMQTMTAYIVQVSLGDTPTGAIAYKTIFAVGTTLFVMTLILNLISIRIVRRFKEAYE